MSIVDWRGKAVWSVFDNFAQQGLSFLVFAVLARWLTPHQFGLLAISQLIVQFFRLIVLDAVAMPVTRGITAGDDLFSWLFTLCTVVSLGFAALMALSAPVLVNFFQAPELLPVMLGMSFVTILYGLVRTHEARLLRDGNFRLLAIRSLCSVSTGGAVGLFLAFRGWGAMALVAQQATIGVVGLGIAFSAEWRTWRPHWVWSNALISAHRGEMYRVGASALLSYANNSGDGLLVSVLLGPSATGLYNFAKRVLSAPYLIIGASLGRVSMTLFIQHQGNQQSMCQIYLRMLATTFVFLFPVYTIVSLLAEPLVVILFGAQWRSSAPLFGLLSVAYLSQATLLFGQSLSFATNLSDRVTRLAGRQLAAAAILATAAGPLYGAVGIATGLALASLGGAFALNLAVGRQLHIPGRGFLKASLPAFCGGIASIAVVRVLPLIGLKVTEWLSLGVTGFAGLFIYVVVSAITYKVLSTYANLI